MLTLSKLGSHSNVYTMVYELLCNVTHIPEQVIFIIVHLIVWRYGNYLLLIVRVDISYLALYFKVILLPPTVILGYLWRVISHASPLYLSKSKPWKRNRNTVTIHIASFLLIVSIFQSRQMSSSYNCETIIGHGHWWDEVYC